MSKLTEKEFGKLQDDIIDQVLLYTNNLIEDGIKRVSWTLTNDFVITFRDLKRKPRRNK